MQSAKPGMPLRRRRVATVSDDIVIGGGGSTAVATSELFDDAQRLNELRALLLECHGQIVSIDRLVRITPQNALHFSASALAAERAMVSTSGLRKVAADIPGRSSA